MSIVTYPIKLISRNKTYIEKFRSYGFKSVFKFSNPPSGVSELDWLKRCFGEIAYWMEEQSCENDHLGFTLQSLNLKSKDLGYIAFRPASEINKEILWDIFGSIILSNIEFVESMDTFVIECTRVNLPGEV
jgi:hypothetical protein